MTKQELAMLEKVYEAEISGALEKRSSLFQSRSKIAKQLADDGYLSEHTETMRIGNMLLTNTGYLLTHAGRLTVCLAA